MKTSITKDEYDRLTKQLEFNVTTRNSLLIFSFTAVFAILGVAIGMDMNRLGSLLCLVPYCLIIPFSARISYYRRRSAQIEAFLAVFSKDNCKFQIGSSHVKEQTGAKYYGFAAWLINHEMLVLAIATSLIFWIKADVLSYFIKILSRWDIADFAYLAFVALIAIALMIPVIIITNSTYDYGKMYRSFQREWENYYQQENN